VPDIQVTDQLDKPVESIKVDLTHPSSLVKYLKTELLHLAVVPDFLERKDTILTQAATKPIEFQANAQHKFQLGNTKPEIDVTPTAQAKIRVNATPNSNLFENDPFHAQAKVPDHTGYVSVGFHGALDLGVSGSNGDLTFGFDKTSTVSLEYLKAFRLGPGEPKLGEALGQTLSCYVIPADLTDLGALGINDIATVSGEGSLKVSGGVKVTASPNPLASVDLPLGVGAIALSAGTTAALSATFTISGSYQIRARRKDKDTIELSFLRERGTTLKADLSVSGGITAKLGDTDLIAAVLGAISSDPIGDKKLLADLQPAEIKTLTDAIKGGLNHSLQASLDAVFSAQADDQAAFQYEIQPAQLSNAANLAVHMALDGDLTLLTLMEDIGPQGGVLAPGVKMLNSVLTTVRQRDITLKINLLGILNFLTVSELVRHSEVLTDAVSGDVTIKETVTGNRISAIVEPMARNEALRKAIFDSLLVTTSYRAGKAVAVPNLSCDQMHFALNQNTNQQILGDYLSWFVALKLLTGEDKTSILSEFIDGGPSTCILRTSFRDSDCSSMFLDKSGNPRAKQEYLEIGRQGLRALLDPQHQTIDYFRDGIVSDEIWPKALQTGANPNLGILVGLTTTDPRVRYLMGDVFTIIGWAEGMVKAGAMVQDMRAFVDSANPAPQNNEFKQKRDAFQKAMAGVVKASTVRFDEPWGMVCLFWAGGSPNTAYAKSVAQKLTVERGGRPAAATATA
jgi:hypothetical protein